MLSSTKIKITLSLKIITYKICKLTTNMQIYENFKCVYDTKGILLYNYTKLLQHGKTGKRICNTVTFWQDKTHKNRCENRKNRTTGTYKIAVKSGTLSQSADQFLHSLYLMNNKNIKFNCPKVENGISKI